MHRVTDATRAQVAARRGRARLPARTCWPATSPPAAPGRSRWWCRTSTRRTSPNCCRRSSAPPASRGYNVLIDQTDGDAEHEKLFLIPRLRATALRRDDLQPARVWPRRTCRPRPEPAPRRPRRAGQSTAASTTSASTTSPRPARPRPPDRPRAAPYRRDRRPALPHRRGGPAAHAGLPAGPRAPPGCPFDEELVISTAALQPLRRRRRHGPLLDLEEPPDAVFCYSDLVASGALHTLASARAARSRGRRRRRLRRHRGRPVRQPVRSRRSRRTRS